MAPKKRTDKTTQALIPSRSGGLQRMSVDLLKTILEEDVWLASRKSAETRCPFRKSYASVLPLGTPGSSPAPEATLERGAPRENLRELAMNL
jgi:hypothetical protein